MPHHAVATTRPGAAGRGGAGRVGPAREPKRHGLTSTIRGQVMRFHEPGVPVLLMSLKCGVGLNLTCASTVVMCAHSPPHPLPLAKA